MSSSREYLDKGEQGITVDDTLGTTVVVASGENCCLVGAGAWLMAPEVSLCVVNDQPVGNPKRKV
jgi:hypothetical protein